MRAAERGGWGEPETSVWVKGRGGAAGKAAGFGWSLAAAGLIFGLQASPKPGPTRLQRLQTSQTPKPRCSRPSIPRKGWELSVFSRNKKREGGWETLRYVWVYLTSIFLRPYPMLGVSLIPSKSYSQNSQKLDVITKRFLRCGPKPSPVIPAERLPPVSHPLPRQRGRKPGFAQAGRGSVALPSSQWRKKEGFAGYFFSFLSIMGRQQTPPELLALPG